MPIYCSVKDLTVRLSCNIWEIGTIDVNTTLKFYHSCWRVCCSCGGGTRDCRQPPTHCRGASHMVTQTFPCSSTSSTASWLCSECVVPDSQSLKASTERFCSVWSHILSLILLFSRSPWTLAVSLVLLPVLRQLIGCQREERWGRRGGITLQTHSNLTVCLVFRYLETTSEAVEMIVHRFSDSIETCKCESLQLSQCIAWGYPTLCTHTVTASILFPLSLNIAPHRSRRLSAMGDRQQRVACYHELHATCVTVEERLAQKCDSQTIAKRLRNLETALAPYRTELRDS